MIKMNQKMKIPIAKIIMKKKMILIKQLLIQMPMNYGKI